MAKEFPGRVLEKKVADAYRQLGAKIVEHNTDLNGNQIDVYVELETPSGLLHRIAVESKDWARPVGISVVNSFANIVRLLRNNKLIDEGVVVSASGFSRQARMAGKNNGIRLFELKDLELLAYREKMVSGSNYSSFEVSSFLISFDTVIGNLTDGFTGREFVFSAIDRFFNNLCTPSGYFLLRGDPGIGKSTFLAQLISNRNLSVYHFNISLQSINTPRQFIGNICARLIRQFNLPYAEFPKNFDTSGTFLNILLEEASSKLNEQEKLIIAVDAIDEVNANGNENVNPLYLPPTLPEKVYVVLTARRKEKLFLPFSNIIEWELESTSKENQHDIRSFVTDRMGSKKIELWIKQEGLTQEQFLDIMTEKSEGNFMYLNHVLPAIASGWLSSFEVADLPYGLRAYYHMHWNQMHDNEPERFERICQPIVCVLGAAQEAVSLAQVAEWTNLEVEQVRRVLKEWMAFLHVEVNGDHTSTYRIYHTAFRDFLQEEVDPGLRIYHAMIAQSVLEKLAKPKVENGH